MVPTHFWLEKVDAAHEATVARTPLLHLWPVVRLLSRLENRTLAAC